MASTIGNRVYKNINRPDRELVEKFRGIPSSNIGDMMNRLYNMQSDIKAFTKGVELLGTAYTVKAPEGDNMMFHLALQMAQPGDVLVIDAGGSMERSLCGEMMFNEAIGRGLAGFVINGCIRDADALDDLKFPVYAKGITPQGPWKNGPGEINVPVCCGNVVVFPGDILVGDPDGIVVIHSEDAPAIVDQAREKYEGEQKRLAENREGIYPVTLDKWMKLAKNTGVEFIEN